MWSCRTGDARARVRGFAGRQSGGPNRRFYRTPSRLWEPDAGQVRQKAHGRHLRAKGQAIRPDFSSSIFLPTGDVDRDYVRVQKKTQETPPGEITRAEQL